MNLNLFKIKVKNELENRILEIENIIDENIINLNKGEKIYIEELNMAKEANFEKSIYVKKMEIDDFINHVWNVSALLTLKELKNKLGL